MVFSNLGMGVALLVLAIFAAGSIKLMWGEYREHLSGRFKVDASEQIKSIKNMILATNFGEIEIELEANSPIGKENFLKLALDGFYDGTRFHRLINDFLIQGGDPLSRDETRKSEWGHGGPGYTFADEIDLNRKMTAGTVAFANSGPNTNGSQFFILTKDADWLNGQHTVLGKVVRGMEVAETISKISAGVTGVPNQDIILRRITFK